MLKQIQKIITMVVLSHKPFLIIFTSLRVSTL